MKIGITYNLRQAPFSAETLASEYNEEFDSIQTINAICSVFEKNGFETVKLGWGIEIANILKKEKIDFVFNIAEGLCGRNREAHMPSLLEMLNVPYSGSDPLTLALTLDKIMTKKIVAQIGILTPNFIIVRRFNDLLNIENKLLYPLITKPAWEGSSKGIYNTSRVNNKKALEGNTVLLLEKYPDEPIIVEEYIKGREITVGIIGNGSPRVLGLMEIVKKDDPGSDFIYSLEIKRNWQNEVEYIVPPQIDKFLQERIRNYALLAFKEFGCRDFARLDFRIADNNQIYLLEINLLPGLSPEYSDLVIMAAKLGTNYEELILSILHSAFLRNGLAKQTEKLTKVV